MTDPAPAKKPDDIIISVEENPPGMLYVVATQGKKTHRRRISLHWFKMSEEKQKHLIQCTLKLMAADLDARRPDKSRALDTSVRGGKNSLPYGWRQ